MNFNSDVDKGFVDAILESSLWNKAKIEVAPREEINESNEEEIKVVPELEDEGNSYEEPSDIEINEDEESDDVTFTLDDLQVVLDNLEDEDLMEHALNMLDVFDVAYEHLNEGEEVDEDIDEEDEDADELEEDMKKGYGAGAPPHSAEAERIARKKRKKK